MCRHGLRCVILCVVVFACACTATGETIAPPDPPQIKERRAVPHKPTSDPCPLALDPQEDFTTAGLADEVRVKLAKAAFARLDSQLALETLPLARARCLGAITIATFYKTPRFLRMDQMPPEYLAGRKHLDAALELLDGLDAPQEEASLCLEVAAHFPWIFASGFIGPNQTSIIEGREQLLRRAATRLRAAGDAAGELRALRLLQRRDTAELERCVALAAATERESPSFAQARDLEKLARSVNMKDTHRAIRHMTEAASIMARHPSHQREHAEALLWLGLLHKRVHQRAESIASFEAALRLYQNPQGEKQDGRISYTARFLGSMALENKDPATARTYYQLALTHQRSPRDKGESLMGLALVFATEGKAKQAVDTLQRAQIHAWTILASEFDRFFDTPLESGVQRVAARLFRSAGYGEAAASIEAWPSGSN